MRASRFPRRPPGGAGGRLRQRRLRAAAAPGDCIIMTSRGVHSVPSEGLLAKHTSSLWQLHVYMMT